MIRRILRKVFKKFKSAKIIMLHYCQDENTKESPCVISTENLITYLDSGEKYISVDDLDKGAKHYDGARCVTIDDSLFDLYTVAYPLLTERQIPFTAFVSSDLLDTDGYITTDQLHEMAQSPYVTIGSHGATHKLLDTLSVDEQRYEIEHSKKVLEEITGKEVKYFAYSNGRYTKETVKLLKSSGYKCAFTVVPRAYNVVSSMKKYELPRLNLTDKTFNKI